MTDCSDFVIEEVLQRVASSAGELTVGEAECLLSAPAEMDSLICRTADELNQRYAGDQVTYILNATILYTDVCLNDCHICAFRRRMGDPRGFALTLADVLEEVRRHPEVTDFCLTGGLNPRMSFDYLLKMVETILAERPEVHVQALSPTELVHFSAREGRPLKAILKDLQTAGVGSISGNSAEILVDRTRGEICPRKIDTHSWCGVMAEAHGMGLPSGATMLFGHIETDRDIAEHLETIRQLQQRTGGFVEFVPIRFIPGDTRLARRHGLDQPAGIDRILRIAAVSRLFFAEVLPNISLSWATLGTAEIRHSLGSGINDLGGISRRRETRPAIPSSPPEEVSEEKIRELIRSAGKIPCRRDSLYRIPTTEPQPRR